MDNFFVKSGSLFNYNMAQFSLDKYNGVLQFEELKINNNES